jgi:hypothetical protein
MVWYISAGILFLIAIALLVFNYVRDQRYLKKKTSEAMGEELWEEIQAEREASMERQRKFKQALDEAGHKTDAPPDY